MDALLLQKFIRRNGKRQPKPKTERQPILKFVQYDSDASFIT